MKQTRTLRQKKNEERLYLRYENFNNSGISIL